MVAYVTRPLKGSPHFLSSPDPKANPSILSPTQDFQPISTLPLSPPLPSRSAMLLQTAELVRRRGTSEMVSLHPPFLCYPGDRHPKYRMPFPERASLLPPRQRPHNLRGSCAEAPILPKMPAQPPSSTIPNPFLSKSAQGPRRLASGFSFSLRPSRSLPETAPRKTHTHTHPGPAPPLGRRGRKRSRGAPIVRAPHRCAFSLLLLSTCSLDHLIAGRTKRPPPTGRRGGGETQRRTGTPLAGRERAGCPLGAGGAGADEELGLAGERQGGGEARRGGFCVLGRAVGSGRARAAAESQPASQPGKEAGRQAASAANRAGLVGAVARQQRAGSGGVPPPPWLCPSCRPARSLGAPAFPLPCTMHRSAPLAPCRGPRELFSAPRGASRAVLAD